MPNTAILLGAGFSANMGYPTASKLNKQIIEVGESDFTVQSEGTILFLHGNEDFNNYSSYREYKIFLLELIKFYRTYKDFDYEKFYDFYQGLQRGDVNQDFEKFCDIHRKNHHSNIDNFNLLSQANKIFNQLIAHFLVDKDGNSFYKPAHCCFPIYPGYTGFLDCTMKFGQEGTVNIHTLNHDLLFETFNSSDWLKGELTDGFEELGSPYYGDFREIFKVRLSRFTNRYNTTFRLFKLHGSVDQFPFRNRQGTIEAYFKIKPNIFNTSVYKEDKNENGELEYFGDVSIYHADFLTGINSKILRYREPLYYSPVFNHFEENLRKSDKLIIIGYGLGDLEINKIIHEQFINKNSIYLVEPYPNNNTYEFTNNFGVKLIQKDPDIITYEDFK